MSYLGIFALTAWIGFTLNEKRHPIVIKHPEDRPLYFAHRVGWYCALLVSIVLILMNDWKCPP
jgi:hypothetical protein